MQISPALLPPDSPIIRQSNLPEVEQSPARAFADNLRDLQKEAAAFSYALALFDMSQLREDADRQEEMTAHFFLPRRKGVVWGPWQFMAAKYGALSIRNFGQALHAAQGVIGRIPSWEDKVDRARISEARKKFDRAFPNIDKVRHSVAHPEFYSNPEKDMSVPKMHLPGYVSAESGITMQSGLLDRMFTATFQGVVVSYNVTSETAETLILITRECYEAVRPLDGRPR